MKLYIVRHGQCEWNALHKVCGSTDSPLTEIGRAQAIETAALIAEMTKDHPIDLIIASPLSRALDTGKAIQKIIDSFRIDHHWKEEFKKLRPELRLIK